VVLSWFSLGSLFGSLLGRFLGSFYISIFLYCGVGSGECE
jgi:hypothetical protein